MMSSSSSADTGRISGLLCDHLFYLPENSEVFLGRDAHSDIVIDEDMVSRVHAKILTFHNQIWLQDLNSTHGTDVNLQTIQDARLLTLGDVTVQAIISHSTASGPSQVTIGWVTSWAEVKVTVHHPQKDDLANPKYVVTDVSESELLTRDPQSDLLLPQNHYQRRVCV